jgi:hypothetical protein
MAPIIAPIIQTIISVAAALFGIWLGTRLSRSKDERQWRRDRCLEAYTDILRTCSIMLDQGMTDYLKKAEGLEHNFDWAHISLVTQNASNLYRALDKITLLSSIEICTSAKDLVDECCKFSRVSIRADIPSNEEWEAINRKYVILYDNFKAAARNDLLTIL